MRDSSIITVEYPSTLKIPEPCGTLRHLDVASAPKLLGTFWKPLEPWCGICTKTSQNLPEPSATLWCGICIGTSQNLPEPSVTLRNLDVASAPEPLRTFRNPPAPCPATCTRTHRTLRNLDVASAPKLPRTFAEASGTLRNLDVASAPKPLRAFRNPPEPSGTLRNLALRRGTRTHRSL